MAIEIGKKDQPVPPTDTGVRRRGLLSFGTLMAAFTGASAVAALGASSAQAAPGPGDKYVPIAEKGAPSGVAALDGGAKILPSQLPDLSATYAGLIQLAKNPDTLIAGAVTVDASDQVTSAAVLWPDGTPGTFAITARHTTGAVTNYNITYGSPVKKTFTQPTITRNTNGAATNVPQIVVS